MDNDDGAIEQIEKEFPIMYAKVYRMRERGLSYRSIAKEINKSVTTASYYDKKFRRFLRWYKAQPPWVRGLSRKEIELITGLGYTSKDDLAKGIESMRLHPDKIFGLGPVMYERLCDFVGVEKIPGKEWLRKKRS